MNPETGLLLSQSYFIKPWCVIVEKPATNPCQRACASFCLFVLYSETIHLPAH